VLILALAACGGDGPTNPNGGGVTNFTAKIDGADWNAEIAPIATNPAAGMYVITAVRTTGSAYTLVITLNNITGAGSYPLGVNLMAFGGNAQLSDASSGWATPLSGAAGTIDITTLTATQMVATFEFVAGPILNTASTRTVTQGQFDVTLTGTGGVAAANLGSSIVGTIGSAFTAAQVAHGLPPGASSTLTVLGNNTTRSITISVANMTGANTYALSSASSRTIMANTNVTGTTAIWTSALAGGSGSVTITSVTADRIRGTFTAMLVPAAGSSGISGTLTVSGELSIGRGP
jgi:hypothetical protein